MNQQQTNVLVFLTTCGFVSCFFLSFLWSLESDNSNYCSFDWATLNQTNLLTTKKERNG